MRFLCSLLLVLLLAAPAAALDIPAARGYVNDRAGLLSLATTQKLERFLRDFDKSDSTQIVVLTVPNLQGETVEGFALKVFEKWQPGQKDKDNGALLLVAKQERKLRIEVGYGLEGRLTDLLAGRIIDNEISPRLKQGDFDGGISAGVVAMAEAVRGEYKGKGKRENTVKADPFTSVVVLFLVFGSFFGRLGGGRRRRGRSSIFFGGPFFGGGGGGGGGFSGGGGSSGGGGASGGW